MLNILPWISGLIPFASHKIHTKKSITTLFFATCARSASNPKPGINYYIEIADSDSIQLQEE